MKKKEIERYPTISLITNRLAGSPDLGWFQDEYDLVAYQAAKYDEDDEYKRPYWDMPGPEALSVMGMKGYWPTAGGGKAYGQRFFALCEKGSAHKVIGRIMDNYDNMTARETRITGRDIPDGETAFRIAVTLLLNTLGKTLKETEAFSLDGALYVIDHKNFLKKGDEELLALKIEIREGRTLWAGTVTFRNPEAWELKGEKRPRVYRSAGRLKGGEVAFRSLKTADGDQLEKLDGEDLCVFWVRKTARRPKNEEEKSKQEKPAAKKTGKQEKENAGKIKRNMVPYLPFLPDDYERGKLSVLDSVLESLNKAFGLDLSFSEYPVAWYDECQPGEDTLRFLKEYMKGRRIFTDGAFDSVKSEELAGKFKDAVAELGFTDIEYPSEWKEGDMVLRTCAERDSKKKNKKDKEDASYRKGRGSYEENALQHIVIDGKSRKDMKNTARRILMELFIKDCVARRRMPPLLADRIQGWTFTRYKTVRCSGVTFVRGATLRAGKDGTACFEDIDQDSLSPGISLDSFLHGILHVDVSGGLLDTLAGAKNGLVMSKGANTYILKDRNEIPLLDLDSVQAAFERRKNDPDTYSFSHMKNVDWFQDFFRGYCGLHLFVPESGNYCYFAGIDHTTPKITESFKIDRMPHAREIIPLNPAVETLKPEEGDLREILEMLKLGFGRWNEIMTYPFPFKFLYEYLDKWCLDRIGRHWDESPT